MNIRCATAADIPALLAIQQSVPSAAQWSPQQYAVLFSGERPTICLVLEHSGTLSAFLVAQASGPEWELENIAVHPDHQRHGFASALVSRLVREAQARNAEAIFLEVRESNATARRFYSKCGFVETGRRKAYYSDPPEDAILYARVLAPKA